MTFVRIEQSEFLALKPGRVELASIRLGQHAGRWLFALSHQQLGGDHWGSSGPLGFTEGREPRDFASRDEALAGAIAHARGRWAGREREMAEQFAWLDTLIPDQPDLFSALSQRAAA